VARGYCCVRALLAATFEAIAVHQAHVTQCILRQRARSAAAARKQAAHSQQQRSGQLLPARTRQLTYPGMSSVVAAGKP
jgi:hypothetical protein